MIPYLQTATGVSMSKALNMKKLIINIIILVQVVGISTFCNTKGTSKNYYISNNGNDSNSGTSMKAP
jgi:hypothetical protein